MSETGGLQKFFTKDAQLPGLELLKKTLIGIVRTNAPSC